MLKEKFQNYIIHKYIKTLTITVIPCSLHNIAIPARIIQPQSLLVDNFTSSKDPNSCRLQNY